MKQLFLHIGCPKTGSTSIQSMYGNNPHLLHDAGYAFPPFTQMPESSELRCFKTNGQSFTSDMYYFRSSIFDFLNTLFANSKKVFISYEALTSFGPDKLAFLDAVLRKMKISLTVILVVRNLYPYFFSLWGQNVLSGYKYNFSDFTMGLKDVLEYRDFRSILPARNDPFRAIQLFSSLSSTKDVIVLHYDAIKHKLLETFAKVLGTDYIHDDISIRNKSLSYKNLELLRCITNTILSTQKMSVQEISGLFRYTSTVAKNFANDPSREIPFDKKVLRFLAQNYAEKIRTTNQRFNTNIEILSGNEQFCEPIVIKNDTPFDKLIGRYEKAIREGERQRIKKYICNFLNSDQ